MNLVLGKNARRSGTFNFKEVLPVEEGGEKKGVFAGI